MVSNLANSLSCIRVYIGYFFISNHPFKSRNYYCNWSFLRNQRLYYYFLDIISNVILTIFVSPSKWILHRIWLYRNEIFELQTKCVLFYHSRNVYLVISSKLFAIRYQLPLNANVSTFKCILHRKALYSDIVISFLLIKQTLVVKVIRLWSYLNWISFANWITYRNKRGNNLSMVVTVNVLKKYNYNHIDLDWKGKNYCFTFLDEMPLLSSKFETSKKINDPLRISFM